MKIPYALIIILPVALIGTIGVVHAKNAETYPVTHALSHSMYNGQPVNVSVRNGVATISGDVDSGLDRSNIEKVVSQAPGVNKVINLITTH